MDQSELVERLKQGNEINGETFDKFDWPTTDIVDLRLSECVFRDSRFFDVGLAGAHMTRCQFKRCFFSQADLRDAKFDTCIFVDHDDNPTGCSFRFTNLQRSQFIRSDLSFCLFERSDMYSVEMSESNLRAAQFKHVDFSYVYSRKVTSNNATFRSCNMEFIDLTDARLADCDLSGSRLREADLSNADLTSADLRDTDLFQANLDGANLARANLRGAEIIGLDLMALDSFSGVRISAVQAVTLMIGCGADVEVPFDER